jgi:hypothetical protein
MKKYLLLTLIVSVLCSCTTSSSKISSTAKNYFDNYFKSKDATNISWKEYGSSSVTLDGEVTTAYFSYQSDSNFSVSSDGTGWGGALYRITLDYNLLKTTSTSYPLKINVSTKNGYSGTHSQEIRFKQYDFYTIDILSDKYSDYYQFVGNNKVGCSMYSKKDEMYGNTYTIQLWENNYGSGYARYRYQHYKQYGWTNTHYDEIIYEAKYYYSSATKAIEGMSAGSTTFSSYSTSGNTQDASAMKFFTRLNSLFLEFGDTEKAA